MGLTEVRAGSIKKYVDALSASGNTYLSIDTATGGSDRIVWRIEGGTGLKAESWMAVNTQLLAAFNNQTMTTRVIRAFVVLIACFMGRVSLTRRYGSPSSRAASRGCA